MPSSYTTRNRLTKQGAGEGLNTWGTTLNTGVFDLIDTSIDGWTTKALTADATLTSSNGSSDESRAKVLKFTGTGSYTVTIPSVEKVYIVWNALTGNLTLTTGAGTTQVIDSSEIALVICDATNVRALGYNSLGIKDYADSLALDASGELPAQAGNSGKFITTNGTSASWDFVDFSDLTGTASRTISAAGLATGGGGLDANRTITVTAAVLGDLHTGTSTAVAVTPDSLFDAAVSVSLTDGATITPDFAAGFNFHVTLGGNRTFANPSNPKAGQSGRIRVVQDGTGSRTLSFGTSYKFVGAFKTLSTAASTVDVIYYYVHDTTNIECTLARGLA